MHSRPLQTLLHSQRWRSAGGLLPCTPFLFGSEGRLPPLLLSSQLPLQVDAGAASCPPEGRSFHQLTSWAGQSFRRRRRVGGGGGLASPRKRASERTGSLRKACTQRETNHLNLDCGGERDVSRHWRRALEQRSLRASCRRGLESLITRLKVRVSSSFPQELLTRERRGSTAHSRAKHAHQQT